MSRVWKKGNRTIIASITFLLVVGIIAWRGFFAQAGIVINESFVDLTAWTQVNVTGTLNTATDTGWTGSILNAGNSYTAAGNSLKESITGRNAAAEGYMYRTFNVSAANPTAKLSFVWKKDQAGAQPALQDIAVRIKNPSGITTTIWSETATRGTVAWTKQENIDISSYLTATGAYEIQLYSNLKAGNANGAIASVNFDEVKLDLVTSDTTPPTFALAYYSDTALTVPLPVDGSGNPVTKAGTVYVKITASEPLSGPPTVSINAPGLSNDVSNQSATLVSGNIYKYTWTVITDSDGNSTVSVSGSDGVNTGNVITSGAAVAIDTTVFAPSLNMATASMGQVDLAWSTAQTDIDHYEVHRSTTGGFTPSGSTLINGSVTATTYADNTVAQATTYYYKIIAVDKVGNISPGSNQLSALTPADTVPPSFTVGYYSDAGMTVTLPVDGNGKTITKAQTVYIKVTASETLKSATVPVVTIAAPGTANDKSNQNMTLVSGNTYSYAWVVAAGATNDGDAAVTITGTDSGNNSGTYNGTVAVNTQIATPSTPAATAGSGFVSLTWSTTDTDITNFKLYRSTTSGFTPDDATNLMVTLGNVGAYTDSTASYPNTYYYKVKSVDIAGNLSAPSAQASGAPQKVNPHGSYGTNTQMCSQCHNSHKSEGANLMSATDVKSTCYLCHDAGGQSTYNAASEFSGTSHHPVPEGTQSCNDCHNPHNDPSTNIRLIQTSTGKTTGNDVCWTCHGTGSTLPAPNGDHQTNYPALGSGHNNNTWTFNTRNPFDPDFDTTSPGKTGIGCEGCHQEHGSSIPKLLRIFDWNNDTLTPQSTTVDYGASQNNKDFCYECHSNAGRADGTAEPDNAWLGKTAYANAVVDHAGTGNSCTLKCHQPHGSSFAARYLSPNETGFDYLKNTYDQNFSATRTTTYAAADFQTCNQCHDLAALVNNDTNSSGFTDKTRNKNLHRVHLLDAGVNGKGNAVCKECHDPHGTSTNWNSNGEHLVAFPATSVVKNTLTYPKFTDNAVGSGGKGTCDLVCHGVAHKDAGALPTVNATYSGAAVASGEGGPCFTCHGTGNGQFSENMVRSTTASYYTHPIANDAEDINASTPNCTTLCHAPHSQFGDAANPGGRAGNLKTIGGPAATVTTTNKDFDPLDLANGGLCMSCHKNSQNDTLHTQPDGRAGTAPWDTNPATTISLYRLSGHNYSVSTTFAKDSSTFSANCTKCHNDNLTKVYQSNTDNTKRIGLHNTTVPWSISKFNLATNPDNEEQDFCYKCHGTATAGSDYYGTPNAGNIESIVTSSTTSTHPVQTFTGKHVRYSKVLGTGEIFSGWLPSTNRHVECGDCHDPHTASEGDSLTSGTGTVVKKPDAAVRNVEGVVVDPATWTITGTTLYAQQDYQVCLKCHSKWAWGTSIPNIPSTYNGTTRNQEHQTYAGEPLTVLDEFKPTNLSYHPLFRIGKNQPPLTANSNWTGTNRRLKSTETGGMKYWGGDGVTAVNGRPVGPTWYEPEGLDNTFVDGWGTMSLVSCSDCHGSNNATVEGPHGSSFKWLLKGSDSTITVTTAAGVIQPNAPAYWANPTGNDLTALQANFCINCHRADVYGPGYGVSGKIPNLSRFTHQKNGSDADSSLTSGKGNTLTPYGCTNCHGGFETGGIHGSSMPAQTGFADASGKRFMNGASWAGHNLGTTSVTCTTASSSINTCTQHGNASSAGTLNYSY